MSNLVPDVDIHDTYFTVDWRQLVAFAVGGLAIAGVIAWLVLVKRR